MLCVLYGMWKETRQHLSAAMVLIVGILVTVFLCYHFHTEYSIPLPPCIFSSSIDFNTSV
jgi:hypothetical protein